MIRQTIAIPEYRWTVYAYYAVDTYYAEEIAERLRIIGAEDEYLEQAVTHMERKDLNNGLTYSNLNTGETVLVVGLTSSPSQFINSLVHELRHFTSHICEARNINLESEESCYIAGSTAQRIYPKVVRLLAFRI